MQKKELLIMGIDPGTTLGYALVDLKGSVVETGSSKQFNLNSLIKKITSAFSPVIVGTDKHKVPSLVERFAVKVGAKLILPPKDMLIQEKRDMIKDFKVRNSHELDALASALFAYRNMKPLIMKIDNFVEKNHKKTIEYQLRKLVLSKDITNIATTARMLEHPEEKTTKIMIKAIEKTYSEKDFFRMYEDTRRSRKEVQLFKQQNVKLKCNIDEMKHKYHTLARQVSKLMSEEKRQRYLEFKEEQLQNLANLLRSKDDEIASIQNKILTLRKFISAQAEHFIVKKMETLGWNEFSLKNELLNIGKNDIILINDPNIFSYKTLDYLRNKVAIVITNKTPNQIVKDELKAEFILSKNLHLKEERYFALVKKSEISKKKTAKNILDKVMKEYKDTRTRLRI